ncbi:MAG: DUF4920 domain-containing protein [Ignavibacteriales bacterium]|nr:DUF4920 domain-containing protein [Ignavibacteriales bacterium]MCB9219139.1 DUF4920 domain-containing protein [Ignavibacteriales bacterium]MCB9259721.1 DUF4920 domain-containing protein [Ignavibacteriales bacterium]
MKKLFVLIAVVSFLSVNLFADEAKKYGSELTLTEATPISEILADAESFVGKKVLVEGTVVDVCEKRGCWINLSGDKEFETIRVKVNDGEIVFPMEAKGKNALVEGEIFSIVTEGEGCGGDCSKEGEEKEHKCEHEKTTKKVYMIKGLGAVIK